MASLLTKHKFTGIGEAGAGTVLAALATNPSTIWLTTGLIGKALFLFLTFIFSCFASLGLVLVNVGASRLTTAMDKINYDGTFESAEKLINEIRSTGRELTPAEIKKIDDDVIKAFRKFAKIGKKK